jgi:hypothetical protein
MTQYSVKSGLKKFKEKGEDAISKELMHLHLSDTFAPQCSKQLSMAQKVGALEFLMFLNEKRDRHIKGRACADGRNQRENVTPGDASPPTVSLELVLIKAAVESYEVRDVVVVDVPGSFLSADMDEEVLMTLRGRLS